MNMKQTYANLSPVSADTASMSERPSNSWVNKQYLISVILNNLGLTEDDLDIEPSLMKAKVRDSRIDEVLSVK